MIRGLIKHTAETLLGGPLLGPVLRGRTAGRDLVLAYHNVVPAGEPVVGTRSLQLPIADFLLQLDAVQKEHAIVPLSDILRGQGTGGGRVAITFDDAYAGVVETLLPDLARRSVPATVFVAPAFVDGESFWWDALEPADGELPESAREHALWQLAGVQDDIREWAVGTGLTWREMPEYARCASQSAIVAAAALPGIDFASHTWSHVNLAAVDPATGKEELERPLRWLRELGIEGSSVLAYPYGHQDGRVRQQAAAAGHDGALLVEGGWLPEGERPDPYAIPRLNVPAGLTPGGFRMRLRGFLS